MRVRVIAVFMLVLLLLSTSIVSYAGDDLNGVGKKGEPVVETIQVEKEVETPLMFRAEPTVKEEKDNISTAKAVGNMFKNVGPDEESIEFANEFIAPFARILNKLMAVILGLTSLLMMFITVLDLLYMAFPPVRDMLDGGRSGISQLQQGGMRGQGRGYGGYGGRMSSMDVLGQGNYGSGGMQQQQNPQNHGGGLSAIGRWVSDEAIAACLESKGGPMGSVENGMGGSVKSMLFSYMKKRSMFLIMFGICVILFTSTAFTDLGMRVGMKVLQVIMGLSTDLKNL